MNKTGVITIIIMVAIIATAYGYYLVTQKQQAKSVLESSAATEAFSEAGRYTDIEGNPISLADYIGQTVVVTSWASWCPACVQQLQIVGEIANSDEGVVMLAINRAEPSSTAQSFLKAYNILTDVTLILDPEDHFYESINGFTMPENVVYDQRGNIVHHKRGLITAEELVDELNSVAENSENR